MQGVVSQKENPAAFDALKGLHAGIERDRHRQNSSRTARARRLRNAHHRNRSGATRVRIPSHIRFSSKSTASIFFSIAGISGFARRARLQYLRIRAEAIRAARNFMDDQGYTLTDAPIFTPAACEGTTTLFEVNYIDDQKAYLTQSGQLYVEATAAALGKVYTFGPTFRAEKSKTRRHLTEFWMLEPEASYAHLEDMMQLGEGLVSAMVQSVAKNRAT